MSARAESLVANQQPRVLIVEDSRSMAEVYVGYLRREPCCVSVAGTGGEALALIEQETPNALLLDLNLPDMDGLSILEYIVTHALPICVVIISANDSITKVVDAMRAGAYDYLVKNQFDADRLRLTVRNALEHQRLDNLVATLRDGARERYCDFIGGSLPMQAVYHIIDCAAPSRATVFITGESGTGKEICAEAIHRRSKRATGPFIALNCAAIPRDLMESEIFGHVRGAFTGATSERRGAAALADGGTLFLDEVCEMSPELQTKLLRFVQSGSFQAVGSGRLEKVDVRFVCATNRDPRHEVEEGRFREDLFYRLHVIPLHLPPLRDREDDVLAIALHFLRAYAHEEGRAFRHFATDTEGVLLAYDWPGNVRELQNVVRNIVVLNDGEIVLPRMLPAPLNRLAPTTAVRTIPGNEDANRTSAHLDTVDDMPANDTLAHDASTWHIRPLELVERESIEEAIAACDGNIPRAAALLGISASTIYRKRQSWLDAERPH